MTTLGSDVSGFFSGSIGVDSGPSRSIVVFGGDVVVSGSIKELGHIGIVGNVLAGIKSSSYTTSGTEFYVDPDLQFVVGSDQLWTATWQAIINFGCVGLNNNVCVLGPSDATITWNLSYNNQFLYLGLSNNTTASWNNGSSVDDMMTITARILTSASTGNVTLSFGQDGGAGLATIHPVSNVIATRIS